MSYNILIVDDSVTIRAVIARTLEMAKIPIGNLLEASNGKEALEILENSWIDLMFTDINMPVMDGIEMVNIMIEEDLINTVPVVVISTDGSTTRIEELYKKGIKAYIKKPFTPEIMKSVITDLLGE